MESIWQSTGLPRFPGMQGDTKTDVLIIGGGMAGLLCGYWLKQSGVHCIVAEAGQIAGGITKNTTAKATAQHGLMYHKLTESFGAEAAQLYLQANQQAVDRFRQLCSGLSCDWEDQDSFVYSTGDTARLELEMTALERLKFPAEFVTDLPLPMKTTGAVKFPGQGQFHPLKFLAELTPGMKIYENLPIREIRDFCAITDYGRIYADSFLVATHFPFLNTHGSYFLKLYQQRSYVLALEGVPTFDGMYLEDRPDGLSFRRWGNSLLLGGGGHRTGKSGGGWRELEASAGQFWNDARITHRWATQDCMSLDGMPYIGCYSKNTPNLYVATGFNKWGMSSSMVAAQILTDLVQRKPNPYADLFSPSRSMVHAQLCVNALESAKNLLTPTVPRCPHLGCALKWNSREHSWDCPCHGSRFEENGTLIDNPATGDLKKRK